MKKEFGLLTNRKLKKLTLDEIEYIKKNFKYIIFCDDCDWGFICAWNNVSESFIREFQDKADWINISYYQELSEDFIREFRDKVFWPYISVKQNLSKEFCIEFYDWVYWDGLIRNEKYEYFKDLPGYVKLHIILNYRGLSKYL